MSNLNWHKDDNGIKPLAQGSPTEKIEFEIINMCNALLTNDKDIFGCEKYSTLLYSYVQKYDITLYAPISNIIYEINSKNKHGNDKVNCVRQRNFYYKK